VTRDASANTSGKSSAVAKSQTNGKQFFSGKTASAAARHQHHRRADIAWRVENVRVAAFQQLQQPRVLLSAAATEADDVNLLRWIFLGGGRKTVFVNRPAIRVVARRRIRLVQREPFLRLLDAVVMELVVHAPRAE